MGIRRGEITTKIVSDGLILNIDPGNRASTIPSTSTTTTFNTEFVYNFTLSATFLYVIYTLYQSPLL